MAEYGGAVVLPVDRELIGLVEIGRFLGCSPSQVRRLWISSGLPLYKKRLQRVRPGCRPWAYATSPAMVVLWRMGRAVTDRKDALPAPRPSASPRASVSEGRR